MLSRLRYILRETLDSFRRNATLTVASIIGFITVFGVAARNGIMLVSHIRHLQRHEGVRDFREVVVPDGQWFTLAIRVEGKRIVVVDDDVNVHDLNDVEWAIWTRIAEALSSIGESVGAFLQSIVNRNPTPPEK